jgi:hypothetical protein
MNWNNRIGATEPDEGPAMAGKRTLRAAIRHRRRAGEPTGRAASDQQPVPLPRWINQSTLPQSNAAYDTAFAAGAAIFALDQVVRAEHLWLGCWRMRLALKAAIAASRLMRIEGDEASLRDALHLTRAGDDPGPAGRLHALLRDWTSRPLALLAEMEATIAKEAEGGQGAAELGVLLAADQALAMRLGWRQALPLHLVAAHDPALRRGSDGRRLRADEPGWTIALHAALLKSAMMAHAEAVTLARKAEALTTAAEALRTRDEGRGLALVLADDSVAPWRMVDGKGKAGLGSDRAARRFCETLQGKGVLRLLTERPTFRLYGL